jgi:hypothetical protein
VEKQIPLQGCLIINTQRKSFTGKPQHPSGPIPVHYGPEGQLSSGERFRHDISWYEASTELKAFALTAIIIFLELKREFGFHLMQVGHLLVKSSRLPQTYIPSTTFVVIGWLGLFLPMGSVPGRVGMGMTTILTLTAMFR